MLSTSGKQLCPNIRWAWDRGIKNTKMCRGGGQVDSMLAFNSYDPISNPAKVYKFSVKRVFEMNKNKQKEAGFWLI